MKSLLLILAVAAAANACRFPSHLWCSSEDIATECKVYEQCQDAEWTVDVKALPVSVELYYETMCPFCQMFIQHHLSPVYAQLGPHVMNVTIFPYGNAQEKKVGDKWQFTCEHGKEECEGNLFETCSLHALRGDMKRVLPFFACIEANEYPWKVVKTCAQKLHVDLDPILSCYNSSLGNQLEHQMALKTDALKPPQTYVPWIVLNGVHTDKLNLKAQNHLLEVVCKLYKGPKPAACKKLEVEKSVCMKE